MQTENIYLFTNSEACKSNHKMSRFMMELCSCVIKENYGEVVEKVAMFIAKNGPSQLRTIIKHTECNAKQASAIF